MTTEAANTWIIHEKDTNFTLIKLRSSVIISFCESNKIYSADILCLLFKKPPSWFWSTTRRRLTQSKLVSMDSFEPWELNAELRKCPENRFQLLLVVTTNFGEKVKKHYTIFWTRDYRKCLYLRTSPKQKRLKSHFKN